MFCNGRDISILIVNIQFISQNNKIIVSALLLLFSIFWNSVGITEARPRDVSQPYIVEDNNLVLWLGELENLNPDREESGLGDEKVLHVQLYPTKESSYIIEGLEQLEKSSKSDLQKTKIQDEASAVREDEIKVTQVSRTARNAGNACIERYVYRIIYNRVFKIPVCKQGCKSKFRTVKTLAIVSDCHN